jgi:hypothetical protein
MPNHSGDCVLAILQEPDVALSLTFTDAGAWRSMIFEFASKKVVFTEERPSRLSDAQQRVLQKLTQLYGFAPPKVHWRESNPARGDGPSG